MLLCFSFPFQLALKLMHFPVTSEVNAITIRPHSQQGDSMVTSHRSLQVEGIGRQSFGALWFVGGGCILGQQDLHIYQRIQERVLLATSGYTKAIVAHKQSTLQ